MKSGFPEQGISNHKPRKGTETIPFAPVSKSSSVKISNHKPRKGTETPISMRCIRFLSMHFKPQTPQGDGNHIQRVEDIELA